MKNQTEAIRDFFSDSEWLAIEEAMGDYQDYGERAEKLADSIRDKIGSLYSQKQKKEEAHLEHFNRPPPFYEILSTSHRTRCEGDFF